MGKNREWLIGLLPRAGAFVLGQIISRLLAPASWDIFAARLPVILAMIAFWGPIVAIVAAAFVVITMRPVGLGAAGGGVGVGFSRGAPGTLRADPAPCFRLPSPGHRRCPAGDACSQARRLGRIP